jgi:hypothetical protein
VHKRAQSGKCLFEGWYLVLGFLDGGKEQ